MNQSVLFPDIQQWDEKHQVMMFPAQCGGALISCLINKSNLERLSGQMVQSPEQALAAFSLCRFDCEELAETFIEEENFNAAGQIEIVGE